MRLEQLYPDWGLTHQQLLETLEFLTDAQLEYRPHPETPSIRDIVLRLIREERYWIGTLIASFAEYRPVEAEHRTTGQLIEALTVTRQITVRVMEPYSTEGLRAVRAVPADPAQNRPETNMPVSRLIWHAVEQELMAWGQITQRLDDFKKLGPPRDVRRN
ncbi:MAG: hypothetical protein JO250_24115 [Armatimonadetes bacterium]|nr:hypothetical protein [Armatimonadota bacterium]